MIYMTKGLPGSGKTTAAQKAMEQKRDMVRVGSDDLRKMLFNHSGGKFNKRDERFMLKVRDMIVQQAVANGTDVIVDATHLNPRHETHLKQFGKVDISTFDMTHVPLHICLEQNAQRSSLPFQNLLFGECTIDTSLSPYNGSQTLPKAIVVDLDGTLCLIGDRSPYGSEYDRDILNEPVLTLIHAMQAQGHAIVILSGRGSEYRELTETWLDVNQVPYNHLYMRPEGDTRKDWMIKEELYVNHVQDISIMLSFGLMIGIRLLIWCEQNSRFLSFR